MATLLPALAKAPAPAWVKPGVRVTYYSAAAAIPGQRYLYYRDEEGGWVDEHGNRYRREMEASASGHGFTQVNVVAMARDKVLLSVRSYGLINVNGPPVLMTTTGSPGTLGCAGDWWVNPSVLQQAVGMQAQGVVVARTPYTIQDQTYKAIRVQYASRNSKMAFVYDEPSGVLLFTNSSVYSPASDRTSLSYSSYRGTRTVQLPWAQSPVPNWLAQVQRMQYQGRYAVTIPGSPVIPLPMAAAVQVRDRGQNWLHYTLALQMGGVQGMPPQTSQSQAVSGHAQVGGLFISSAGLRRLRQGQTIDRDPLTQVTTQVAQAGGGAVTISELGPSQRMDYTYNAQNGMLVGVTMHDQHLNMRRELRLTGSQ
ncbi:MAG: hypothetical protein ACODAJ_15375 [Planctomycetota bacterium]